MTDACQPTAIDYPSDSGDLKKKLDLSFFFFKTPPPLIDCTCFDAPLENTLKNIKLNKQNPQNQSEGKIRYFHIFNLHINSNCHFYKRGKLPTEIEILIFQS